MKLVFHIGVHKTGSTAIQSFLWHHRDALLAEGILYPSVNITLNAQHQLAWSLGVNHPRKDPSITPEGMLDAILAEAKNVNCRIAIISSEDFEFLSDAAVKRLRVLTGDIQSEIVVYLRRQDELLLSIHNQQVKARSTNFVGAVEELGRRLDRRGRFDYWSLTERWANVFGDSALIVRLYEKSRFPNGNIVGDFLSLLESKVSADGVGRWQTSNESLHPLAIEALRRINARNLPPDLRSKLLRRLQKVAKERPRDAWVSAEFQQDLMERFRGSNTRVAQKWFGRSDGVLFVNSPAEQAKNANLDNGRNKEALIDMLIDALIATVKAPTKKRSRWRGLIGR